MNAPLKKFARKIPAAFVDGKPVDGGKAMFLLTAETVQMLARYSGPVDVEVLEAAKRAMAAWLQLSEKLLAKRG
jgi:hypothetical protein